MFHIYQIPYQCSIKCKQILQPFIIQGNLVQRIHNLHRKAHDNTSVQLGPFTSYTEKRMSEPIYKYMYIGKEGGKEDRDRRGRKSGNAGSGSSVC